MTQSVTGRNLFICFELQLLITLLMKFQGFVGDIVMIRPPN